MLWLVGGAIFLFRSIFRDPKVDLRFLIAGVLVPDLIDLTVGTLLLAERYSSGRLFFHTLIAPVSAGLLVMVLIRRGSRRRRWLAFVIGMFFHLLLEGMWANTTVFLWPLVGDFPAGPSPYWALLGDRLWSDPWRWLRDLAGIVYLFGLGRQRQLIDPMIRHKLLRTGVLDESESVSSGGTC